VFGGLFYVYAFAAKNCELNASSSAKFALANEYGKWYNYWVKMANITFMIVRFIKL